MTEPGITYTGNSQAYVSVSTTVWLPAGSTEMNFQHLSVAGTPEAAIEAAKSEIMKQIAFNVRLNAEKRSRDDDGNRLYYAETEICDSDNSGAVIDGDGGMWAQLDSDEEWYDTLWVRIAASFVETRRWHELDFPVRAAGPTWTAGG